MNITIKIAVIAVVLLTLFIILTVGAEVEASTKEVVTTELQSRLSNLTQNITGK